MAFDANSLTSEFRAHAQSAGADIVGIAPIGRFSSLPPEGHPSSIYPEVRSVVVIGKRIARGALRGVEEGTQFQLYYQYGRDWLSNRVLATATYRAAEFLEDRGWEAVPLPNLPPETPAIPGTARAGNWESNTRTPAARARVRAR